MMVTSFLKKRNWSARSIIEDIARSGWSNVGVDSSLKEFFMADLCSEYDSINLYNLLYSRRQEFSPYFVQYLDFWYADEKNHADGFFELSRLVFGMSELSLLQALQPRTADFSGMHDILSDEFRLLLKFAYDEYISVKTYKKDTFYEGLGHPGFRYWIKNLIADEAVHFGNAIKLLRRDHSGRMHECEAVLNMISNFEGESYKNTFLFDHDGPHFSLSGEEVGQVIVQDILQILHKGSV
ncbi:hypothetical protein [Pseudomonas sp. UBA4194]|uniref:hypothetical protein n=1 Tax=Pseudomonas sp. UBA4194 TaxID=1947317 RepID=UPI0025EA3AE3|nr:hypothetical protein [Pseudomonas sp. UBA4194]